MPGRFRFVNWMLLTTPRSSKALPDLRVRNYAALSLIGEGTFQGNPYFGLSFQPVKILLKTFLFSHPPHGLPHNKALVPCTRSREGLKEALRLTVDSHLNLLHW